MTIKGFRKCSVPVGTSGDWAIERFTLDRTYIPASAPGAEIMQYISGNPIRDIAPGTYTRLTRRDFEAGREVVVMSDTDAEMREHAAFVRRARRHGSQGRVLVFGLGLGVCVEALLLNGGVGHVDVVELSDDVRALTGPHLLTRYGGKPGNGGRLAIHAGDVNTWEPPDPAMRWSEVWIDIWDTISDTHTTQMAALRSRFANRTSGAVGCWAEDQGRRMDAAYLAVDQLRCELGDALHDMPIPDRIERARKRTHEIVLKQARMGTGRMDV
jgi:hypothetical protein